MNNQDLKMTGSPCVLQPGVGVHAPHPLQPGVGMVAAEALRRVCACMALGIDVGCLQPLAYFCRAYELLSGRRRQLPLVMIAALRPPPKATAVEHLVLNRLHRETCLLLYMKEEGLFCKLVSPPPVSHRTRTFNDHSCDVSTNRSRPALANRTCSVWGASGWGGTRRRSEGAVEGSFHHHIRVNSNRKCQRR
jgi:hypothetical protein